MSLRTLSDYAGIGFLLSITLASAGCTTRGRARHAGRPPAPSYGYSTGQYGYGAPPAYSYPAPLPASRPAPSYGYPTLPPIVAAPPPIQPRYVTVLLRDVAVAPKKPDGRPWDCCGNVSPETANQISSALSHSPNPYAQAAAVFTLLTPLAGQGTTPPEIMGSAQLYVNAQPRESLTLNRPWQQDSYTPLLTHDGRSSPAWTHVPLEQGTRIVGSLWDKDIEYDDSVGPFDIGYEHLVAALHGSGPYPVRVDKTILFIRITVMTEQ